MDDRARGLPPGRAQGPAGSDQADAVAGLPLDAAASSSSRSTVQHQCRGQLAGSLMSFVNRRGRSATGSPRPRRRAKIECPGSRALARRTAAEIETGTRTAGRRRRRGRSNPRPVCVANGFSSPSITSAAVSTRVAPSRDQAVAPPGPAGRAAILAPRHLRSGLGRRRAVIREPDLSAALDHHDPKRQHRRSAGCGRGKCRAVGCVPGGDSPTSAPRARTSLPQLGVFQVDRRRPGRRRSQRPFHPPGAPPWAGGIDAACQAGDDDESRLRKLPRQPRREPAALSEALRGADHAHRLPFQEVADCRRRRGGAARPPAPRAAWIGRFGERDQAHPRRFVAPQFPAPPRRATAASEGGCGRHGAPVPAGRRARRCRSEPPNQHADVIGRILGRIRRSQSAAPPG